jgi:hypothetical protein
VRVKIGCQDLSLVPNTRIGEIEKGFYEFQYTRELLEATPPSGNRGGINDTVTGNGGDQGTPKRQRTGGNDTEAGSQSAPPGVGTGSYIGTQRQSHNASQGRQCSEDEKGKRKAMEDDSPDLVGDEQANNQNIL